MAIVGTAYVRVQSISTGLAESIKRDIQNAAKEAERAADIEFRRLGESGGKQFGAGFKGSVGDEMSEGLKDIDIPSADLYRAGDKASKDVARGFNSTIKERLKEGFRGINFPDKDIGSGAGDRAGNAFTRSFGKALSTGLRGLKIGAILAAVFAAPGVIAGAGTAITALATSLVSGIAQLGPAIAGIGVTALAGLAPLILAMKFVGLGMKADEDAADALSEKVKILEQVIGKPVADELFPGLNKAVDSLTKAFAQGAIQDGLGDIGAAVGGLAANLAKAFSSTANVKAFGRILSTAGGFIEDISKGAEGLVTAFVSILDAIRPVTQQLGVMIGNFGEWAGKVLSAKAASGELTDTFQRLFDKARALGDALLSFGSGIAGIFAGAAPSASGFLETLGKIGARFDEWTHSEGGREEIGKFFANMKQISAALLPLIGGLAGGILKMIAGFDPKTLEHFSDVAGRLGTAIGGIFEQMAQGGVGNALLDVIDFLVTGLQKLVDSGLIGKVSEGLTTIIEALLKGVQSDAFATTLDKLAAGFHAVWDPLSKLFQSDALGGLVDDIKNIGGAAAGAGGSLGGIGGAASTFAEQFSGVGAKIKLFLDYISGPDFQQATNAFVLKLDAMIQKVQDFAKSDVGKGVLKLGAALATAAVLMKPFFSIVSKIGTVFGGLGGVLSKFGPALRIAFGPVGAIVALLVGMWTNSEKFRDAVKDLVEKGLAALLVIWDKIRPAFEKLLPIVQDLLKLFGDFAGSLIEKLVPVIERLAPKIGDLIASFMGLVGVVLNFLMPIFEALWPVVEKAFDLILAAVEPVITIFQGLIDFFTGVFTGDWSKAFDGLGKIVSGAFDLIVALFGGLWDLITTAIGALFGNLLEFGGKIASNIWDGIKAGWEKISEFFTGLWTSIVTWLGDILTKAAAWGLSLIQNIVDGITEGAPKLLQWFMDLPGKIAEFLGQIISDALEWGGKLIVSLVDGLIASVQDLWDWFIGLATDVTAKIGAFIDAFLEIGGNIIGQIVQGLVDTAHGVWDWFTGIAGNVIDLVGDFIDAFLTVGGEIIGNIVSGLGDAVSGIASWFAGLPGQLAQAVSDFVSWAAGVGAQAAAALVAAFTIDVGDLPGASGLPKPGGAGPINIPGTVNLAYLLGKAPSLPVLATVAAGPPGAGAVASQVFGINATQKIFTDRLTAARFRAAATGETHPSVGDTNVRVYIGNNEITQFVRTEVERGEQRLANQIYNGRRVQHT